MSKSEIFRSSVTYSAKGFLTHSAKRLREKVAEIARIAAIQKRLFRKFSKLSPKLKTKFNKVLKKLNIEGKYRTGKQFYKCHFHEFNKGLSQGIILNRNIKSSTHLVNLTKKSPKEIFFVSSQVEVVALQGILSEQARNGQKYFFMLHEFAPLNITPQCKMGGIPSQDKLVRGAKFAEARAKLGTHFASFYDMVITGRSCTLFYDNERGEKIKYSINNPCSRTDYGSGKDGNKSAFDSFKETWLSLDLPAEFPAFEDIQSDVRVYFSEMKNISKEYLPYFFGNPKMSEETKNFLNEKFWENKLKVSTNLINLENISGAHVDTAPETYNFFSMLSLQSDGKLDGEGELAFPGLGFRIQYQTGDVILMRPDCYHGICPMTSKINRYSAVFYNNFTKTHSFIISEQHTPSVLLRLSPSQTVKPSTQPSSVSSEVPSAAPSLLLSIQPSLSIGPSSLPTATALVLQGINLSGYADKCMDYDSSSNVIFSHCDTSLSRQEFKLHDDGRITVIGSDSANKCLLPVSDTDLYLKLVTCDNNLYMIWNYIAGRISSRVGSWCLDANTSDTNNILVIVNPC